MCVKLKEEMRVENINKREKEIVKLVWDKLKNISKLHILAKQHKNRLAIFSFYIEDLHYNLGVKMLNDYFGVQTRGGCSCAGTYGHYLLNVSKKQSNEIIAHINNGDCSLKPGWIRLSFHPTDTNEDIGYILQAISELAKNHKKWAKEYEVNLAKSYIRNSQSEDNLEKNVSKCFSEHLV